MVNFHYITHCEMLDIRLIQYDALASSFRNIKLTLKTENILFNSGEFYQRTEIILTLLLFVKNMIKNFHI